MEFVDLAAQQKRIRDKIESNISAILDHGHYIMGPEVKELEVRLAKFAGVKHAVGCASGTDALLMALMAFDVGPGDAIFTTPFTFIATAEVIGLLGATPVFVDIEPRTFNIDPAKLNLAVQAVKKNDPSIYPLPQHNPVLRARTSVLNPKGIIPVDLFGHPADYQRIGDIARKEDLFVVEDAAQSCGAESNGTRAGAFGDIACTSFYPAKPLGCYGDGGMCFTDNDQHAEIMDSIRIHGKGHHQYDNVRIGVNGRLDTLQAGVLLAKLEIFPEEIKLRRQVANRYVELLEPHSDLTQPVVLDGCQSVWAQYSILARDTALRTALQNRLKDAQVPTAVYYPKPLHLQSAFSDLGYKKGGFPVSEDCANRIFSIPMHPYLSPEDQKKIADILMSVDA